MVDIRSKLKDLMLGRGIASITELSRQADIPQPTLHKIMSGYTKSPRQSVLNKVSQFFDVPTSYFSSDAPGALKPVQVVPVKIFDGNKLVESGRKISIASDSGQVDFLLNIEDNRFFPVFQMGSYLFVSSDFSYLDLAGIYVIKDSGDGVNIYMTFYENSQLFFSSVARPTAAPISISGEQRKQVIGVILEVRSYLAPVKNRIE